MGTGGSRYGAGRPGWRRKCEQLLALDIRKLSERGYFNHPSYFSWHWSCDGEPRGTISIAAAWDHARLHYTWTPYGAEPRTLNYVVSIERARCHFGGARLWFRCPRCRLRRAVIYGVAADGRFGCRGCMRLGYASEAEDALGRLWRKQRKLERRLLDDGEKPKGMHRATYEKICRQIDGIEERKDVAFGLRAIKLLGMDLADFIQ